MSAAGKPITDHVAQEVSKALVGAFAGWLAVYLLSRYTPLRPAWWVGVGVGAAVAGSYQWNQENS